MIRRLFGNQNGVVTQAQRNAITAADTMSVRLVQRVRRDLDTVFNQRGRGNALRTRRIAAWNANTRLVTWLGRVNGNDDIVSVRRRFNSIERRLDRTGSAYEVFSVVRGGCRPPNNAPAGSVVAAFVVGQSTAQHINLCPSFFTMGSIRNQQGAFATGVEVRASTIVHETVHKLGIIGRRDRAINSDAQALAEARTNPDRARRRPRCYQGLVREYI